MVSLTPLLRRGNKKKHNPHAKQRGVRFTLPGEAEYLPQRFVNFVLRIVSQQLDMGALQSDANLTSQTQRGCELFEDLETLSKATGSGLRFLSIAH